MRALLITLGVFALLAVLAVSPAGGMLLLALLALLALLLAVHSRSTSRECPRCGQRVKRGELDCPHCGFDFRAIGGAGVEVGPSQNVESRP